MSTVGNQVVTTGQKEENKEVGANKLPTPPSTAKKSILFCLPLLLLAWLFSEEYYLAYEQQNSLTWLIKPIIFLLIYGLSFYLFFSWIYERVRAKFADSAHFLNYAIIYIPLCLFLLSAASALYKGSSEVFAISPAVEREEMLKAINTELLTYKSNCSTTAAAEHAACVEQYLTDSLLARLMLLEDRAQGFANSYSVIAIMTGFFGVLMTVLIIYFSIAGKEAIQQKLTSIHDEFRDIDNKLDGTIPKIDQKLNEALAAIQDELIATQKHLQKLETSQNEKNIVVQQEIQNLKSGNDNPKQSKIETKFKFRRRENPGRPKQETKQKLSTDSQQSQGNAEQSAETETPAPNKIADINQLSSGAVINNDNTGKTDGQGQKPNE